MAFAAPTQIDQLILTHALTKPGQVEQPAAVQQGLDLVTALAEPCGHGTGGADGGQIL